MGEKSPYQPPTQEGPHQAQVQISGVDCSDCVVRIALFDHQDRWLRQQQTYRGRLVLISGGLATLTFYGLLPGQYAAAAFVDSNNNGRLDRWFGLLPREPVAFSVVHDWRMPPSFEESSFSIPSPLQRVISVRFSQSRPR